MRKASREDAQAFRLLIDRAESDSSPLGVAVRDVLRLVGERALVLHGPEELAGEEHGGDLDCAIQGMDPWWPLKLAGPWRLRQCFHYDIRAWTWVVERDLRAFWIDTMEDPLGLGRNSFPTANLFEGKEPVIVASPATRAAYLTAKRLRKGIRGLDSWRQIGLLARDDPQAFRSALRHAVGDRLAGRVAPVALRGDPPQEAASMVARRMLVLHRFRSPRRVSEAMVLGARRRLERVLHPTGLVILLVGPDGSGKSTVAQSLHESCEGIFARQAKFHWRPGLLPRLGAVLGREASDATDPHQQAPHGAMASLLVAGYYWLDFVLGGWARVTPIRLRGGLVVMERGWWDLAVDPTRYRLKIPQWIIRLLGLATPRPDLAFVLEGEPATLHARKAELPPSELARQTREWRRALPSSVPTTFVDTSPGSLAVQAQIREHIASHLERRATRRLASGWASLPGPKSPRWLLPRGPRSVSRKAVDIFQPMNFRGRMGWEVTRLLAAAGGLRLLPRGEAPPRSVRERLAGHLAPGSTLALSRANHPGRYVALILSEEDRDSRIVKVATDPRGEEALEREGDAIERLGSLLPRPLWPPTVIAREPGLLVLRKEEWRPRLRPWRLDANVARGLGRFFATGSRDGGSTGAAHGDFAPWNLLRTERGWVLIDWEYAFDAAPPVYDLFNFLIQSAGHLRRPSSEGILRSIATGEGWIGAAMTAYGEGAGLDLPASRELFADYLVASRERLLGQAPVPEEDLELRERLLRELGS